MQLFSADATIFSKKYSFAHKKLKKPPSQVGQKNSNPLFSLLPGLPKWPKQKNLYSKMWLIEQLYIELRWQLSIFELKLIQFLQVTPQETLAARKQRVISTKETASKSSYQSSTEKPQRTKSAKSTKK